jgi:hypothetical protein
LAAECRQLWTAGFLYRWLKRDRPDLAEQVISGGLSANAADIEAGFRHRTFTVPDNVEA